jgi:four helix bundle protein
MKSYRDLKIYSEARRLAIEIHKMTLTLPKFELYEEGSQLRKSSKSVAANIVEGYARNRYKKDFVKHLVVSQGECDETIFHLEMVYCTGSLTDEEKFNQYRDAYDKLSKMINRYIQWLDSVKEG